MGNTVPTILDLLWGRFVSLILRRICASIVLALVAAFSTKETAKKAFLFLLCGGCGRTPRLAGIG